PSTRLFMPVVLAFDTAGSACSVAVGRDGTVLGYERREMRHGHAEALLPMIGRVMTVAGLAATEIDFVAVSTGPGGFTGIRAGLAGAQGLALATGAQLVGVNSFAAVAALVPKADAPLLVALDSRRADPYVQLFSPNGEAEGEPAAVPLERLRDFVGLAIDASLRVAGDAAEAAAMALSGSVSIIEMLPETAPDARGVLVAAFHRLPAAVESSARPLYLRAPDVSLPKARP
ncbi:MAG TPA: tRNA (adenosine(37)-N6)-threonylcarbamoyltransferase complex dimerization subunit type 1 TsaB, partial [Stellaceae bacterium]|nr:tRNA (adenosine(37)-N6)-threonylcarbamoyltransferase complex dimerization subunit type 1 TsaB [Stellaceae bacterium]